jgi:leader peptidase (prepilin peptidase)/N-methyltransferase
MGTGLSFLIGIVVGSFLNTCIYRLPRGESVITPSSYCPTCRQRLRPRDLIPLGGFFLLGGRCHYCHSPIAWRYPAVEVGTGLLAVAIFYRLDMPAFLPALGITAIVIAAAVIDLERGIIPNSLTFPAIAIGLFTSYFSPLTTPWSSFVGVVLGGGILLVIAMVSRGGMGGGDIKLMAAVGAWLGWQQVIVVLFLACLMGGVGGIWLLLLKIKESRQVMVFGPFIAMAVIFTLLGGDILGNWYLRFVWGVLGW